MATKPTLSGMRLTVSATLGLFIVLAPAVAVAGPPALPGEDTAAPQPEAAPTEEVAPPTDAAPPSDAAPTSEAGAGGTVGVDGAAAADASTPPAPEGEAAVGTSAGGKKGKRKNKKKSGRKKKGDEDTSAPEDSAKSPADDVPGTENDPGFVQGRREPTMQTLRGSSGLFHTQMPDVGGLYTFRFQLHSDFFNRKNYFFDGDPISDRHGRVRGTVNLGFTFTKWTEIYFAVHGSANRNTRTDPARQDPSAVFALGDMDFGIKGAWRGVKGGGVGVGGVIGLGLVSGSDKLLTDRVNFNIDGLFALDLRYLTKRRAPVRFALNLGYIVDNSNKLLNWGAISDNASREILRFGLGANNSRVRQRYSIDFPMRLGKKKGFGLDPFLEWSWDVVTGAPTTVFAQDNAKASPLPRSQMWITLGTRMNVVDGLFLSAGLDIGVVSPSYEFGPPTAPLQGILGIGWSFDPKGRRVEVAKPEPVAADPIDGRVMGRVLASDGTPVADAKVSFPGQSANTLLTDAGGGFTSVRFPAGVVAVTVLLADGSVVEQQAEVLAGQDTLLDIQLEGPPPQVGPPEGVAQATITDPAGVGIANAAVRIAGQGIDEVFVADGYGQLAVQLPVGAYTAHVEMPGYLPADANMTIEEGQTAQLSIQLMPPMLLATPNVTGNAKGIKLKKAIRYEGDAVAGTSNAILDELASFLQAHSEYTSVEIRVHTDDRGNPSARSQARADSVKAYLMSKGISDARLSAVGYGSRDPIAVNMTADGRRQNNRTQLLSKPTK